MRNEAASPVASRPIVLRLALVATALAVVLGPLAGCGDGRNKSKGALREALSYLPADTAAVLAVATDPDHGPIKDLDELGSDFVGWDRFKARLKVEIGKQGVNYDDEIGPQLGNPAAIGVRKNGHAVGAIRVQDPKKLRKALEDRIGVGLATRLPDYKGALVTRQTSAGQANFAFLALFAQDLVGAQSLPDLKAAIDSKGSGRSAASNTTFSSNLARLGDDRLVRIVGDAQRLLDAAGPAKAARARKIRWFKALGLFTGVLTVKKDGVSVDFRVASDRLRLSNRDLPIVPGPKSPLLHDLNAATAVAVLEPRRLAGVIEEGVDLASGSVFRQLRRIFADLRRLGVDPRRDLLRKLTSLSVAGNSSTEFSFAGPLVRGSNAGISDTLGSIQPFVRTLVPKGVLITAFDRRGSKREPLWHVQSGGLTIAQYGIKKNALVGAVGLSSLPHGPPDKTLPGVEGGLVLKAAPPRIATAVGSTARGALAAALQILSQLGDLTLGVRAETDRLTGSGMLEVGQGG